jgi:hypothetical protein
MPQPMSAQAWNGHMDALYDAHKQTIEKHLFATRENLRCKLKKDNPEILDDDIADIPVTFDGQKEATQPTMDLSSLWKQVKCLTMVSDRRFVPHVINKKQKESNEYKEWYTKHKPNCGKNYEGSSGNMEVSIAEELWKRSLDFKMRYKYIVCDGDSKAYTSVWDVYGCCKTCEKYERMDRQSKEYGKWVESKAYTKWKKDHEEENDVCHHVKKLDCISHVQKLLGTALRELKKKTKGKLKDRKSVGRKGHRLSDKTIDKLQEYYGKAIRCNVSRNAKSEQEINSALKSMQDAIFAVLYHSVMLPDTKKRHKICPKHADSWCQYVRTKKEVDPKVHYTLIQFSWTFFFCFSLD